MGRKSRSINTWAKFATLKFFCGWSYANWAHHCTERYSSSTILYGSCSFFSHSSCILPEVSGMGYIKGRQWELVLCCVVKRCKDGGTGNVMLMHQWHTNTDHNTKLLSVSTYVRAVNARRRSRVALGRCAVSSLRPRSLTFDHRNTLLIDTHLYCNISPLSP